MFCLFELLVVESYPEAEQTLAAIAVLISASIARLAYGGVWK